MSTRQPPALDERGLPAGYPFRADWEVTPRQTREEIARGGSLILDIRRPDERQTASIAGSAFIPMEEIGGRLDEVEELAGGKDAPIIVYCHHGRRSLTVTDQLRRAGFAGARSMAGGIDLWSKDIDPGVPAY